MNPILGHVSPHESFQSLQCTGTLDDRSSLCMLNTSVRLCVCLHSSDSTALQAK